MLRKYLGEWDDPPETPVRPPEPRPPLKAPEPPPAPEDGPEGFAARFGHALESERHRRLWSQRLFASQLGVTVETYRRFALGKGGTVKVVEKLCDLLGWSVALRQG